MKKIPLTQGLFATVSDEDYDDLIRFKWCAGKYSKKWYAVRRVGEGKNILMHRYLLNAPEGVCVDHRNGDGLDNVRDNIRLASHVLNNHNTRRSGTSTYKGVSWNKEKSKWAAQVRRSKVHKHLGYFSDEKDAAQAYNAAALSLYGSDAVLNVL